jgi:hypothetical protein
MLLAQAQAIRAEQAERQARARAEARSPSDGTTPTPAPIRSEASLGAPGIVRPPDPAVLERARVALDRERERLRRAGEPHVRPPPGVDWRPTPTALRGQSPRHQRRGSVAEGLGSQPDRSAVVRRDAAARPPRRAGQQCRAHDHRRRNRRRDARRHNGNLGDADWHQLFRPMDQGRRGAPRRKRHHLHPRRRRYRGSVHLRRHLPRITAGARPLSAIQSGLEAARARRPGTALPQNGPLSPLGQLRVRRPGDAKGPP